VKAINHFEQNRPVHLARRDVYFERAGELLTDQQRGASPEIHIEDYEEILFLLRIARQHAGFSIRDDGKNEDDELFFHFINLLVGNVKAVLSMMNLKQSVECSEGFFFSFLGGNYASVALQAEEYLRRAKDIDSTIHNTLTLAEKPFLQLKEANAAAANKEDLARYNKAREHFSGLVREEGYSYKDAPGSRKIL
jgi:hypothetical protein